MAVAMPVTMFVAPGPERGDGDADLPGGGANPRPPCASRPASWRTSTWRIGNCVIAS